MLSITIYEYGQTIIYSEYVTDVIDKLSRAVSEKGYSYALYTNRKS